MPQYLLSALKFMSASNRWSCRGWCERRLAHICCCCHLCLSMQNNLFIRSRSLRQKVGMLGVGYLTTTQWPTLVDFDSSSQNIPNGSHSVICMPLIMQLNDTGKITKCLRYNFGVWGCHTSFWFVHDQAANNFVPRKPLFFFDHFL